MAAAERERLCVLQGMTDWSVVSSFMGYLTTISPRGHIHETFVTEELVYISRAAGGRVRSLTVCREVCKDTEVPCGDNIDFASVLLPRKAIVGAAGGTERLRDRVLHFEERDTRTSPVALLKKRSSCRVDDGGFDEFLAFQGCVRKGAFYRRGVRVQLANSMTVCVFIVEQDGKPSENATAHPLLVEIEAAVTQQRGLTEAISAVIQAGTMLSDRYVVVRKRS